MLTDSGTRKTLLNATDLQLLSPEFSKAELKKHAGEVAAKLKVPKAEVEKKMEEIFEAAKIEFIPEGEYSQSLTEARKLSPDPNDVPYLALALAKRCPLGSQDKALKKQARIEVLNTAEIMGLRQKAGKGI